MKKIILLSLLTIVGILSASQMVLADTATLSTSPASLNSTVGTAFNVSVNLQPANNKVCVVTGTVSLNNLSCQGITVASGLMAQTTPTCANPSFVLGIPKCATTAQNLFSVSVKGTQAGQANLSITGVKVIGEGVDVAFSSQSGTYNIVAPPVKTTPKTTTTPTTTTITTTTLPAGCTSTSGYSTTTGQPCSGTVTIPQTTPNTTIPASAGAAALANSGASQWLNWILIIAAILIVIYAIYYFATKRKKK